MIIARSPLRISLGGGGTDLPSYYRQHGGFLIAGAIDKYVYVSIHRTFVQEIVIRYSQLERVGHIDAIVHPLMREALRLLSIQEKNIEITTMADIPSGTGLGSSGSFGTALLKALYRYRNEIISQTDLAAMACRIEIDILKEPVGKQDQYAAALGGLNCFTFHPDGRIEAEPLRIGEETLLRLQQQLLLFCTGITRSAPAILKEQDTRTAQGDPRMLEHLHHIKDLGHQSRAALEAGDLEKFADLMHVHWVAKRQRSGNMTTSMIDDSYEQARRSGARGGKLVGAGGGGFLMFYADNPVRLREAMAAKGMMELVYRFEFEGTKIV